jgi:hypothetical protein
MAKNMCTRGFQRSDGKQRGGLAGGFQNWYSYMANGCGLHLLMWLGVHARQLVKYSLGGWSDIVKVGIIEKTISVIGRRVRISAQSAI